MKRRIFAGICIILVIVAVLSIRLLGGQAAEKNTTDEMIAHIESVLEDKWGKSLETKVIPIIYKNENDGSSIIYYVCHTTFFSDEIPDTYDPQEIIRKIVDPETVDESTPCKVCDIEAMRYRKSDHSYLCFTISSEYSVVFEYSVGSVSDADIIKMAESIQMLNPEKDE